MKSLSVLAGALAIPCALCYFTATADEAGLESCALNGADGAAVVAMTNDELAADGTAQTATATGGNGGNCVNVGINAPDCVAATCSERSGSRSQSAGNGGNGGTAMAVNVKK